ncbi:cytochrome b5-like isoform X1 [Iris pallida]|uniref:Cytochrome b5-like isoform X1 n=1 Tax=Iris pallida TaxID=29817 RepID=A0AAX6II28_IRIPA|nr:cytochrome b5-like isoform X1 [Iris pallida]
MSTTITNLYSMQEASQYNTKEDCWIVIDGKVYDVTQYLDDHPGGDDVLLSATGKDSTEDFEDAGHSKDARELMKQYAIGELDASPPAIAELEIFTKEEEPSSLTHKLMDITTQYWTYPAAALGVSVVVAALFYARKK